GLLLRSYVRLAGVDAGFDPRPVRTLDITLREAACLDPARQAPFFQDAADTLTSLPGVASAAGMSWLPFTIGSATSFQVVGRSLPPAGQDLGANVRFVTPGLFRTLGIPLKEGRDFTKEDGPQRPDVVVVSEALAREIWPGESPLGKRLHMEWGRPIEAEVVGVVGDIRQKSLDNPAGNTLYWPQAQVPTNFMTLVVKSAAVPAASLTPAAVAAIRGIDRGVAV